MITEDDFETPLPPWRWTAHHWLVLALFALLAAAALLRRTPEPATLAPMPTTAPKKKPARKVVLRASLPRPRLPAFMQTDSATGLAVAKARPGVRVLSTVEVRALADA